MAGFGVTKYKPEYVNDAYEYLASGKSIVQLARTFGVCRDTIYVWEKAYPDFKEALKIGRDHSQAHWETELESMMYNKEVNTGLVKLYFANRFKWLDRPEGTEEIEIVDKKKTIRITRAVRDDS